MYKHNQKSLLNKLQDKASGNEEYIMQLNNGKRTWKNELPNRYQSDELLMILVWEAVLLFLIFV